jgi:hypothetical protein
MDGDGCVTESDIRALLNLLTGKSMSQAAEDEVVRQTFAAVPDSEVGITLDAFTRLMDSSYIASLFVPVRRAARDQYFLNTEPHRISPTE